MSNYALEEWKELQGIIARLEDGEYKLRNWLLALLTGLCVAILSGKLTMSFFKFSALGQSIIFLFMVADLTHRIPKRRAIERAKKVEEFLRGAEEKYEGPNIAEMLGLRRTLPEYGRELWRMLKHTPYLPLMVVAGIVAYVAT